MIVCICANVSERQLVAVIEGGANSVKEVGRRCGAGAGCGSCRPLIRECLRQCREAAAADDVPFVADAGELAPA